MRKNILEAIYNKFNEISEIKEVHNYNKGHFDNYPAVVILGSENERTRESVGTIKKVYKFRVQVLQEVNENAKGQEDGEDLLNDLNDKIDEVFDADDTLGGVCDDVQVSSSFAWEDREFLMRVLEIEILCTKLKQLT